MSKQLAFSGQADVYIRFLDPDIDTGYFLVGDINEMSIKTESEKKELVSNQKTRKGVLAALVGKTTHTLSAKSKYFDKKTFAMRAGGVVKETALVVETVVDELIENVKVGGMYPLKKSNVDASDPITAKKGKTGTTSLVAADFEIIDGFFKVKTGGALVDGDSVRVSYKTFATNRTLVKGGKRDKYSVAIKYKGVNSADNDSRFDMEIFRAEISSEGDFSMIGDDFGEAAFSGPLVLVDGKDSPYEYETFD